MIFRNNCGNPICTVVSKDPVDLGVEYAEEEAIRRGMKLALAKGYSHVMIESDCLKVTNAINKPSPLLSYLEFLLHDIEILSHAFSSISFNHFYREANKVAHNLSKVVISVVEQVWMGHVPPASTTFIMYAFRQFVYFFE